MTKQYELTKKIHEELKRLAVEIEFNELFLVSPNYKEIKFFPNLKQQLFGVEIPAIQEPQIRQILLAVADRLGENAEFLSLEHKIEDIIDENGETKIARMLSRQLGKTPYLKAEALCHRWLDGLKPLFQTNPEQVLEELLETLESL